LKGGFWFECLFVQKPFGGVGEKKRLCVLSTRMKLYTVFIF